MTENQSINDWIGKFFNRICNRLKCFTAKRIREPPNSQNTEDIFAETMSRFLKIWESKLPEVNAENWDSNQPALQGLAFRIAQFVTLEFAHERRLLEKHVEIDLIKIDPVAPNDQAQLTDEQVGARQAFERCKPATRMILNEYVIEGLGYLEIQSKYNINHGAARQRVNRAMHELRERYAEVVKEGF